MGFGLFQEIRAKQTIDKLSLVSAPTAKVVRDGSVMEIDTQQLVIDEPSCTLKKAEKGTHKTKRSL